MLLYARFHSNRVTAVEGQVHSERAQDKRAKGRVPAGNEGLAHRWELAEPSGRPTLNTKSTCATFVVLEIEL